MHGTVAFGACLCAVQKLLTTKKSFFGRLFGALLSRPRRPLLLRLRWRLVLAVAVVLVRRVVVLVVVAHQALLDDGAPPWNSNSASASAGSPIARRTTGLLRSHHRGRHGLKLMQDAQQGSSPASCWADSRAQQRFQRPERQTGHDKKSLLREELGQIKLSGNTCTPVPQEWPNLSAVAHRRYLVRQEESLRHNGRLPG